MSETSLALNYQPSALLYCCAFKRPPIKITAEIAIVNALRRFHRAGPAESRIRFDLCRERATDVRWRNSTMPFRNGGVGIARCILGQ